MRTRRNLLGFPKSSAPECGASGPIGDPSAARWGEQATKGSAGDNLVFWGSERSRLGSAGCVALIPVRLEKGEWPQAPPDV